MRLSWYEIIQEARAAGIYVWYNTESCGWRAKFVTNEDPQIFVDIIARVRKKHGENPTVTGSHAASGTSFVFGASSES